jgi:hypothetical protein
MHHPIRPKKRKNPGIHKIPRVSFNPVSDKIKKFITGVFDVEKPLIKPSEPKVEEEKQPKQKEDKTRYKWERSYNTDTNKFIPFADKKTPNPNYGKTYARGWTKGPDWVDSETTWEEQGVGKSKWRHRPGGKQGDPKGSPGVRFEKQTRINFKDVDDKISRKWKSVTRYKRSSAGYSNITKIIGDKKERISFPTRKELKAHNEWAKEQGLEGLGPAIRKQKTTQNPFGEGTTIKNYYRGKLRPKIKYYKY